MQLFIDSYGAYLGVRDGRFRVSLRQAGERLFAVRDLHAIFLSQGVTVSTNALYLALENDIPVLFIDALDRPMGMLWNGRFGSIATVRKNQALFSHDVAGLSWVAGVLADKLRLRAELLERWQTLLAPATYATAMAGLQAGLSRLAGWSYASEGRDAAAASFRGWEGAAGKGYYAALAELIPASFGFTGRSKRPAYDPFNALLNYGYGILYAMVELSLLKAGLDPYTGVLHADEYNRPTLVFDCIERYRHWVEQVALDLCASGQLTPQHFQTPDPRTGVLLAREGKPQVVTTLLAYLDEKVSYGAGLSRRRRTLLDYDAQQLAARLRTYQPTQLLF